MAKRPASDRRSFLRSIANDGAATAGSLFGALGALRGQAESISADLQGSAREPGAEPTRRRAAERHLDMPGDAGLIKAGAAAPEPAFASPIRDEEGAVIVLDVRALPAVIAEPSFAASPMMVPPPPDHSSARLAHYAAKPNLLVATCKGQRAKLV